MALHTIELCAGVGMLGEGLRAGLTYMGIAHRTVCYVEREAHAAAVLAARMEEGSLDAAPVWADLCTFDAEAWRGKVDCVVAGFPCQDLSLAGRRAGLDGARSGLFFNVLDIAEACGAWCLFLENVAGIASATATVVDEAEGELEERAAARVLGELADRGWDSEWITLSASEVGASHGRARWFCWAWRMGHTRLQHHTYSNGLMGPNIREQASAWLTPNAHDGRRPGADMKSTQGANLSRDAAARPTPRSSDGTKGGPNQAGSKGDLMLPSAAAQWPTPAARDAKGANSEEHAMVTGGGGGSTWIS